MIYVKFVKDIQLHLHYVEDGEDKYDVVNYKEKDVIAVEKIYKKNGFFMFVNENISGYSYELNTKDKNAFVLLKNK